MKPYYVTKLWLRSVIEKLFVLLILVVAIFRVMQVMNQSFSPRLDSVARRERLDSQQHKQTDYTAKIRSLSRTFQWRRLYSKLSIFLLLLLLLSCSSSPEWKSDIRCSQQIQKAYGQLVDLYGNDAYTKDVEKETKKAGVLSSDALDCIVLENKKGICKKSSSGYWQCMPLSKTPELKLEATKTFLKSGDTISVFVTDTSEKKTYLKIDGQVLPLTKIRTDEGEIKLTSENIDLCEEKIPGVQYPLSIILSRNPVHLFFCPPDDGESIITYKDKKLILKFESKKTVKPSECLLSIYETVDEASLTVSYADYKSEITLRKNTCEIGPKATLVSRSITPPFKTEMPLSKKQCLDLLLEKEDALKEIGFSSAETNCPFGCDIETGFCRTMNYCCVVDLPGGKALSVIASGPTDSNCAGTIMKSNTGSCKEFER